MTTGRRTRRYLVTGGEYIEELVKETGWSKIGLEKREGRYCSLIIGRLNDRKHLSVERAI